MYCEYCGQQNPDQSKFCSKCGKPLSAGNVPVYPANPVTPVTPPIPTVPAPKKKLPAWVIVVVIVSSVILALGLGVGAYFLIGHFLAPSEIEEEIDEYEEDPDDFAGDFDTKDTDEDLYAGNDDTEEETAPTASDTDDYETFDYDAGTDTDGYYDDEYDDYEDYPQWEEEESDYIIPDSDSRELTELDLRFLSADELRLARNEIYARHGRKFKSQELQDYFDSKPWYYGTIEPNEWSEKLLNKYETYNVNFIADYEKNL